MREGLFWFLVALASFAAVPTCAQTITIAGYARSYSGFYFVRTICPQYFQVNIAFASKISADTLEIGAIHFGKSQLKEAVVKELERRRVEVAATGEAAWCRYQRATMLGEGLTDLFR